MEQNSLKLNKIVWLFSLLLIPQVLLAKDADWAEKRVNSHLLNTGMEIYLQEQEAELMRKKLLLEEEQNQALRPANNTNDSYELITEESGYHVKDFDDSAYSNQELHSPMQEVQLDLREKQRNQAWEAKAREAYIKEFIKNAKDSGVKLKETNYLHLSRQ